MAGARTERVGEQIREAIAELLTSTVLDPGIGFVTITRVKVTPDLQLARVNYTTMGDEKARRETERGLKRAVPLFRRGLAERLRLKRVPELQFFFDESIERQDRIEQILQDLEQERRERAAAVEPGEPNDDGHDD